MIRCDCPWRTANSTANIPAGCFVVLKFLSPDPAAVQESRSTWKTILGFAVGIGVVLLAAWGGVDLGRVMGSPLTLVVWHHKWGGGSCMHKVLSVIA